MILQCEIIRDRAAGTLVISQQQYINGLMERFNIPANSTMHRTPEFSKPLQLPDDSGAVLPVTAKAVEWYQSVVGSLLYASIRTRL